MTSQTGKFVLAAALAAFLLLTAIFHFFPGIDLWASGFFVSQGHFVANDSAFLSSLRSLVTIVSVAVVAIALFLAITNATLRPETQIPNRVWLFMCTAYLLGPGVLVNAVLKNNWGRARPQSVEEFGGPSLFTPPLAISDQCSRNCSFVSGEASSIIAISLMVVLVFCPGLGRKGRLALMGVAVSAALLGSVLRIAKGRHFLSDVLFAADFMVLTTLYLFFAFGLHKCVVHIKPVMIVQDLLAVCRSVARVPKSGRQLKVRVSADAQSMR